ADAAPATPPPPPAVAADDDPLTIPAATTPEALVTAWRRAQNLGRFDAYAALYADGFAGVRRTGKREVALDRKAWLDERRRMFARRMRVGVSDVEVTADGDATVVRLVQDWESAGYRDRGDKELRLVKVGDRFAIASEDMLTSTKLEVKRAPPARPPGELVLAIDGPTPLVAVDVDDEVSGLAPGVAPVLLRSASPQVAGRPLPTAELPASTRPWQGLAMTLYGHGGKRCGGAIDAFYEGTVVESAGYRTIDVSASGSPDEVAATVWGYAKEIYGDTDQPELWIANSRSLLGRIAVAGSAKACDGATWATSVAPGTRVRPMTVDAKVPDALAALGRAGLRALEGYDKRWDGKAYRDDLRWELAGFHDADGRAYLTAGVRFRPYGCPDKPDDPPSGAVTAIWEVVSWGGKPALVRLTAGRAPTAMPPTAALTIDGEPVFVSPVADEHEAGFWTAAGTAVLQLGSDLGQVRDDANDYADCPDGTEEGDDGDGDGDDGDDEGGDD
ncbi:MAG: nuclear transport factor 2 family protein, partial [Myxococcales bacterium]|nr:nuclear transport factor 2 family protein [Myxococcales bacterium]